MPLPGNLIWIRSRFDPFSIVYLDSLVCELTSTTTLLSRTLAPGRSPAQRFANRLANILQIGSAERAVATYLDPKGLGARFKKDHELQQAVIELINESMTGDQSLIRAYNNLNGFYGERSNLLGEGSPTEALVALDAMFACRIALPEDLSQALPDAIEAHPRYVECVMLDEHPKLLTLYDRHVVLSVDRRAFYEWTEEFTKILSVGWHPFTRTIGFYTTSASGQPFIRVLAILMQPYPLLSEVLSARGNVSSQPSLNAVLSRNMVAIQQRIDIFQAAAAAPPSRTTTAPPAGGTGQPPANAPAAPSGGTTPAPSMAATSSVAPARLSFPEYRQLMYPVYVAQMLCNLNGISGTGLHRRARPTYDLLQEYLELLQNLHNYKQHLSPQVLEMAPPDSIDTLLVEPKRVDGQELALYG